MPIKNGRRSWPFLPNRQNSISIKPLCSTIRNPPGRLLLDRLVYPLFLRSKHLIREAVQKNDFLKQLAKEQVIELVECMFEMRARAGQWIIQEGEPGDRLFVIAEGQGQVSREGQILGTMNPGTVMGELAILYNCTR